MNVKRKSMKGLKMHQWRCQVIENMEHIQPSELENSNLNPRNVAIEQEEMTVKSLVTFILKQGIRLAKSSEQRTGANDYFRSIFANIRLQTNKMGQTLKFMNDSSPDFFKANYGTIKSTNQTNIYFHVCKDLTVN